MQVRRKVSGYFSISNRRFELVVGSNTGDADTEKHMFAIGEIISANSTRWIHLKIEDVVGIIEKHKKMHKKEGEKV